MSPTSISRSRYSVKGSTKRSRRNQISIESRIDENSRVLEGLEHDMSQLAVPENPKIKLKIRMKNRPSLNNRPTAGVISPATSGYDNHGPSPPMKSSIGGHIRSVQNIRHSIDTSSYVDRMLNKVTSREIKSPTYNENPADTNTSLENGTTVHQNIHIRKIYCRKKAGN